MKHDMLRRFAFIEARLLWAGGLTASELANAFGIARQNAQETIKTYQQRHPGQMRYDRSQRRQVPEDGFEVHYIRDDVGRFLDYQRAVSYTALFFDEPDWADLPFTDADALIHPLYDKGAARIALTALRQREVVAIGYWAKSGARTRRISPHHLVYADDRYHLRAWCHETLAFLDFVVARIVTAQPCDDAWVSGDSDENWHQRVDLELEINAELPTAVQNSLRQDYLRQDESTMKIRGLRKALVFYVERRLGRVDPRYGRSLWRPCKRKDGAGGDGRGGA